MLPVDHDGPGGELVGDGKEGADDEDPLPVPVFTGKEGADGDEYPDDGGEFAGKDCEGGTNGAEAGETYVGNEELMDVGLN